MDNISKHISYAEATKSNTAIRLGINNEPGNVTLENMRLVAEEVFEKVREFVGKPIMISSFYRSEDLNTALRGSKNSQHCKGEGMDLDGDAYGVSNKIIFDFIRAELVFDQLIFEYMNEDGSPKWVHVSRVKDGNRRQVLRALRDSNGKTKYLPFDLY